MTGSIKKRIQKVEKQLALDGKTQWLRIPNPDNPDEMIEIPGCRTFAEAMAKAYEEEQRSQNSGSDNG